MPTTTPPDTPTRRARRIAAPLLAGALLLGAVAAPRAVAEEPAAAPKTVVYVEVNNNDLANVADYTLQGTTTPAFDMAVIFAANINYDGTTAYLHLNDRVTWTLENAATQIRPVQAKGTKVLLSVLGNHQGAGIANFADYADADAFAAQLEQVVDTYGLDGIDFDDEWSKYGENGTGQPNAWSFVYLVHALRNRLGDDKLITFYNIGPAAAATQYKHMYAGDYLDFAWNPYYGSWRPPSVAHMDRNQFGAGAVDLSQTSQARAQELAQRTVAEGYGVLVTYNLTATNQEDYLTAITTALWGKRTVYRQDVPDTESPQATLVSPAGNGPVKALHIQVDASDNRGLKRIVADVYRRGRLVRSTLTDVDGAKTATHTADVALPDGTYEIRYRAHDLAGNASPVGRQTVTVDATKPTIRIRPGRPFTEPARDGAYRRITFRLFDAGGLDKAVLNGVETGLGGREHAELERIRPGVLGAVAGSNTLEVHDAAGNVTTTTFVLA